MSHLPQVGVGWDQQGGGFELQTIKLPTPLEKSLSQIPYITPSPKGHTVSLLFSNFNFHYFKMIAIRVLVSITETCLGCSSSYFSPVGMKMWSGNKTSSRSKINRRRSEQAIRSLPCWCAARGEVHNVHVRRTNLQPLPPFRENPADQVTQIPAPCPTWGRWGITMIRALLLLKQWCNASCDKNTATWLDWNV